MKLIVGLGNPGPEYACTRHNIGFMVVALLAGRLGCSGVAGGTSRGGGGAKDDAFWRDDALQGGPGVPGAKARFHSRVVEVALAGHKCLLMQPMTYMNRSGLAVQEAATFYKVDVGRDLLVIVDDLALPTGAIRLRPGGGAGSHNGLADVQRALGTDGYSRLRVGVDRSPFMEQKDYLLSRFSPDQRPAVRSAADRAADAAEYWVEQGIDAAMNRHNERRGEAGA